MPVLAATEPGLFGREDAATPAVKAWVRVLPLRSPASSAGKTAQLDLLLVDCDSAATEPGLFGREDGPTWTRPWTPPARPLRSPASSAGKTPQGSGGRHSADRAATEPGLFGREDLAERASSEMRTMEPLRSPASSAGKTGVSDAEADLTKARRYGARPLRPGRHRQLPPQRVGEDQPLRSPASSAGKTPGRRRQPGRVHRAATEPGLFGREDFVADLSAEAQAGWPLRSPASSAGKTVEAGRGQRAVMKMPLRSPASSAGKTHSVHCDPDGAERAATEPGLFGREDRGGGRRGLRCSWEPLRSPASSAGKTPPPAPRPRQRRGRRYGARPLRPGRPRRTRTGPRCILRPLRSPASSAGKTAQRIDTVDTPPPAATEPGLFGREDGSIKS